MEVMHKRVAGLDVHKATVVACARLVVGRKLTRECRTFATTTAGLSATEARHMNGAIVMMVSPPVALFCTFIYLTYKHRRPPEPWHEFRVKSRHPALLPFYLIEFGSEWGAYLLSQWSLLEVLDALRAQQDVMTDYYTALHDYWIAVAVLRAAQGVIRPD